MDFFSHLKEEKILWIVMHKADNGAMKLDNSRRKLLNVMKIGIFAASFIIVLKRKKNSTKEV